MIYIRNTMVTTEKTAVYLGNVGLEIFLLMTVTVARARNYDF